MNCLGTAPNFPIFICYSELHAKQSRHIIPALPRVCKQLAGSPRREDVSHGGGHGGHSGPSPPHLGQGRWWDPPFPHQGTPFPPQPGSKWGRVWGLPPPAKPPLLPGRFLALSAFLNPPLGTALYKPTLNIFITKSLPSTTAKPAHLFHCLCAGCCPGMGSVQNEGKGLEGTRLGTCGRAPWDAGGGQGMARGYLERLCLQS